MNDGVALLIPVRIQNDTFAGCAPLLLGVLMYALVAARLPSRSRFECLQEVFF
jgi:hypothetical protein